MTTSDARSPSPSTSLSLKDRICAQITANGPLTIAQYMQLALLDPEGGYYTNQTVFGRQGDFITAPEVSQMFGELIGIWLATAWIASGRPAPFQIVELGPGRGTLMADLVRATKAVPGFLEAADIVFVEQSPQLRAAQRKALEGHIQEVSWVDQISDLTAKPTGLIANEFFDALPIRQAIYTGQDWAERVIGLDDEGELTFGLLPGASVEDWLQGLPSPNLGDIIEFSSASVSAASEISELIKAQGFAALIVDYGHEKRGYGDTLQALSGHHYADVLKDPGLSDLTAHVDFQLLKAVAQSAGLQPSGPIGQGPFLLSMGLLERAGQLGAGKSEVMQEEIRQAVERLAAPDQMGHLFKVMALAVPSLKVPGFPP